MGKPIESTAPTGARYVDGAERGEYVGRAARIVAVHADPSHTFKGKANPRWVIDLAMLDSGELIAIALGQNAYRDTMFRQVAEMIDGDPEAVDPVVLFKDESVETSTGTPPWAFRSATDEEIAGASDDVDEAPDDKPAPEGKGKGK